MSLKNTVLKNLKSMKKSFIVLYAIAHLTVQNNNQIKWKSTRFWIQIKVFAKDQIVDKTWKQTYNTSFFFCSSPEIVTAVRFINHPHGGSVVNVNSLNIEFQVVCSAGLPRLVFGVCVQLELRGKFGVHNWRHVLTATTTATHTRMQIAAN